jgi:hypothetical protein
MGLPEDDPSDNRDREENGEGAMAAATPARVRNQRHDARIQLGVGR